VLQGAQHDLLAVGGLVDDLEGAFEKKGDRIATIAFMPEDPARSIRVSAPIRASSG